MARGRTLPESHIALLVDEVLQVARTARKHHKSLTGDGFYARKFLALKIKVRRDVDQLRTEFVGESDVAKAVEGIATLVDGLFNPDSSPRERALVRARVVETLEISVRPARVTAAYAPVGALLPLNIVSGARPYMIAIARQALGCYEQGWYDASAVMLRRLLETLIIETFENHGLAQKIKDGKGDFLPLKEIVDQLLTETAWNLSRNAKTALPKLKRLGDLAAHSRRFLVDKTDIDKLQEGLRIGLQELVHLAAYDQMKIDET